MTHNFVGVTGYGSYGVYFAVNGEVYMVIDTGCRRSCGGRRWHAAMQEACRRRGLTWNVKKIAATFQFGNDQCLQATEASSTRRASTGSQEASTLRC